MYSGWAPDAAADDFVGRLAEAGRRYRAAAGGGEAIVPIILDGENAWEHFEGGGRPFLRALYGRLSGHPELRTVTMAEACGRRAVSWAVSSPAPGSTRTSTSGSAIATTSGLGSARRRPPRAGARDEAMAVADRGGPGGAREEMLVAEGSDWFWWYGDDHSSDHDEEFDDLFRRHLRNAYRLLRTARARRAVRQQHLDRRQPPDGDRRRRRGSRRRSTARRRATSSGSGAGALEGRRDGRGRCTRSTPRRRCSTRIRFGFSGAGHGELCLRLDGGRRMVDLLAEGHVCSVIVVEPEARRFAVRRGGG